MKNKLKIAIVFFLFISFFIVFYYALNSDTKNNTQIMVGSKLPSIQLSSLSNSSQKITLPLSEKENFYLINIWSPGVFRVEMNTLSWQSLRMKTK